MNIAIIGAGFAGTQMYKNLIKDKHTVTLFEKSRGAGGRCSTRYIEDKLIDHGTPYFEAKSTEFKNFCNDQCKKNILVKIKNIYYPTKGINKLCSTDIDENDFKRNTKITSCKYENNHWILEDENGLKYPNFERLIITIPTPQILSLDIQLSSSMKQVLLDVEYDSIATLLLYANNKYDIDNLQLEKNTLLKKLVDNSSKYNYKKFSSYVLHLGENITNLKRFTDKNQIQEFFSNEILPKENETFIKHFQRVPHFWKYAFVSKSIEKDYLYDEKISLGLCGDYFSVKNLEGSFLSTKKLYQEKFQ